MLSFSACFSDSNNLTNNNNYNAYVSNLSADTGAFKLYTGYSKTFEVTAKKRDGTADNIVVTSSNTSVVGLALSEMNVTVVAKSVGIANISIISDSGNILNIEVEVLDPTVLATLVLDKSTLNIDENTNETIIATATIDGTIADTVTAFSSDENVTTVSVTGNIIDVIGINPGISTITVVSGSDKNATCTVTVNAVNLVHDDPNGYSNATYSTAHAISLGEAVNDIVALGDDWYVFNTIIGNAYEAQLNKFTDGGGVQAYFYVDPTLTEELSLLTDSTTLQGIVTDTFTAKATTYYVKVINNSTIESQQYTLSVKNTLLDNTITAGAGYIERSSYTDGGITHSFDAVYGKLYEVYVMDELSQSAVSYNLDVITSAYTENMNQTYYADSDKAYTQAELINPVKTEKVNIVVKPKVSGTIGSYAIKIVELTSNSDGMKKVLFPLNDGQLHKGKVGKNSTIGNQWSYYSTNAVASSKKTIALSNISLIEDLAIKVYEDSDCSDEVASANSYAIGSVSLSHTYTKSGTFCVGINNLDLINNASYDMLISGNKVTNSATYSSTIEYKIPDNNANGILSAIVVDYGVLTLSKLTVKLNITHTYDNDLSIYLISPTGNIIDLSTQNGKDGDNYTNTVFDDNATLSISDVNATAPFTNTYKPESLLSVLNGADSNGIWGTWSLQVVDSISGDSGVLNSWSMTME